MLGSDDPALRARSFDVLVRSYWRAVYKHVRLKWSRPADDAADLTQGFFLRAFEKRWLTTYDSRQALFRTFLKTCLDRYVMDSLRDAGRQKRGGGVLNVSLDFDEAEGELAAQTTSASTADAIEEVFDAEWMASVLRLAVETLEAHCARTGKELYVTVFRRYVLERVSADADDRPAPSYTELAKELEISVTDVTNYLAWMRREFRRTVLESLAELTGSEEEWRREARAVLGIDP